MDIITPISSSASATLDASIVAVVNELWAQLASKQATNARLQTAYDQKLLLEDLRISIPPQLHSVLNPVLGWPAKTVDVLADRISFQQFVSPGDDSDRFGLNTLVDDNNFRVEVQQAVTSALIHACSFMTITQGLDTEPDVLWLAKSAMSATGLWDQRRRLLKAGLSVTHWSDEGEIDAAVVYLPEHTIEIERTSGNRLRATAIPNHTGRVLMEPIRFNPDLLRPFGRSRITPSVLSLTGSALRTIARSEVAAEFFAFPQRYAMGVESDAFDMSKWRASMSTFLMISRDENGDIPEVGSFSQQSMQPHTEQLRQWASLLAAESQIPLDELGFPSDNPSSDSAIQSQRDPLRLKADSMIDGLRTTLKRVAVTSVMLRDKLREVPGDLLRVQASFAPTVRMSEAAAADALLKQVQVIPWLAESTVVLEKLGYSADAIERLLADKKRAAGADTLQRLADISTRAGDELLAVE